MSSYKRFLYLIMGILFLSACKSGIMQAGSGQYIAMDKGPEKEKIEKRISPYRDELESRMKEVVGYAPRPLMKGKPNAALGNYISDLLMRYVRRNLGIDSVDAALFNNGGFRIALPGDSIRVETIYELMPFENELVLLTLPYDSLLSMQKYLLRTGGEAVSKEIKLNAVQGQITDFEINGAKAEKKRNYIILTSDYLAEGGDNMFFFRGMKRVNTGKKIRDAIIEAMRIEFLEAKYVEAQADDRIRIEK